MVDEIREFMEATRRNSTKNGPYQIKKKLCEILKSAPPNAPTAPMGPTFRPGPVLAHGASRGMCAGSRTAFRQGERRRSRRG